MQGSCRPGHLSGQGDFYAETTPYCSFDIRYALKAIAAQCTQRVHIDRASHHNTHYVESRGTDVIFRYMPAFSHPNKGQVVQVEGALVKLDRCVLCKPHPHRAEVVPHLTAQPHPHRAEVVPHLTAQPHPHMEATPINTIASPALSIATLNPSPKPAPTLVPIPTATPSYAIRAGVAAVTRRKLQEQQRREKRAAAELSITMKLA
ncbi:hypothetical protein QJQ45_027835 [Haematococcus lacustris]|nr:hypothetical protein QJQ45_027835 [Haematococcus lacustris]